MLKKLIESNKGSQLKRMNIAFGEVGKKEGINLNIESNYHHLFSKEDLEIQAIEVNEDFEKVLTLMDATMSPSVKEIEEIVANSEVFSLDIKVTIRSKEASYEGTVFVDLINKLISTWIDTNDLKELKSM